MTNDLKFAGASPVVINYNGSPDDIYAPVRTSSCDITVVSPKILDDLYTARKDEIAVKIEKDEYTITEEVVVTSYGGLESYSRNLPETSYKIYRKDQFFTDIYGNLYFKGVIEGNEGKIQVDLRWYDVQRRWIDEYTWNMDDTGRYFHDGTDSYMVTYENGLHYISTKINSSWTWGDKVTYIKSSGGVDTDCAYSVDNIMHLVNGSIELMYGKERYTWDRPNRTWVRQTDYSFDDGSTYTEAYGIWYHQAYVDGIMSDTVCVKGYGGVQNCIAKINSDGTLTNIIALKSEWTEFDNLFSINGNLYYMTTNGVLWSWNWTVDNWVEWITFTGDIAQGSVHLDYMFDGSSGKCAVFAYDKTNTVREAFGLQNFNPPTARIEKIRSDTPVRKTLWEGYKMPNTYSQEVSLNLDSISMTCIDPVSILKFVTIDKILEKPNIVTYGELIGKALAYVMLDSNTLLVERNVVYSGVYVGTNGLLDLSLQVANFWDEAEKPSTVYEMLEELLRPFCMSLVYYDNSYQIFNSNKTTGTRYYNKYTINSNGTLTRTEGNIGEAKATGLYDFASDDWKSNNTQTPTIEINSTYDKVTGIASTCVPSYSKMITDLMNYTQRDKYAYDDLNVQTNKTKGYVKDVRVIVIDPTHAHSTTVIDPVTDDKWFYIWNGVYTDAEYGLTDSDPLLTNWYNNCNKAKYYLDGSTGYPNNYGAALTFFGGSDNPTGYRKDQDPERSVKIKDRITAYAPDNGVPPEFLENTDLAWTYASNTINKVDSTNTKFGSGINQGSTRRIVYHQAYDNVCLSLNDKKTVDFSLSQSYSRTGIDVPINIMSNNTTTNKTYNGLGSNRTLNTCNTNYFPPQWNASAVTVDSFYFRRYASNSGSGDSTCRPVWDERVINIYIRLSNGNYLQFDGKNWVQDDGSHNRGFILTKLMNGEHLYHNDLKYDTIISSADPNYESLSPVRYHLGTEEKKIFVDNRGGVVEDEDDAANYILCRPYMKEDNAWYSWIADCSDGNLSIILPYVDDAAASVYVDVYNSNLLGMTGSDGPVSGVVLDHSFPFYYTLSDTVEITPNFKTIEDCYATFMPANITHIKAEHLDLDINISVPESNLGQMFQESDIKYEIDSNNNYVEEYEGPSFLVNTYNPLVASSFSYIVYLNTIADPNLFTVAGNAGRPESYTVQAYFNWLSKIRKIYTKTLVPESGRTRPFANVRCYLKSPEVGTNELLVVRDTWDVKTDRHTVTAVEDHDLEVVNVSTVDVIEIPRMARAERYNLPTAKK